VVDPTPDALRRHAQVRMDSATAGITTIGGDLLDSATNHATDIKPDDHKVYERLAEATQAIQTPQDQLLDRYLGLVVESSPM
jgi:hypothetical protein